ncbi:MAG: hypothetical protein AABY15_08690 [Nanoarchaeota archaeon]
MITKEQKQEIKELLEELHPKEAALILAMRKKFKYGEIVVIMRDGLPFRLKRVTEFDELEYKS